MTSVTIPSSVTRIDNSAFSSCRNLEEIIVEEGNPTYNSANNCNAIINTKSNTLIVGCKGTVIPNTVTTIGGHAFRGCSGLTSITIPNSVTTIEWYAFSYWRFQLCHSYSNLCPVSTSIGRLLLRRSVALITSTLL
ncbi:MAG: leucine-rich repeat domain-containing protein [Prevotella sp.]|nr:leucine-rich repeat domain-containing protein [Prevotella sp.]